MTLAGTRLFATALPLGLTASRLTHSCAYHGLRLCFILVPRCGLDRRGGCPHTHERSRRGGGRGARWGRGEISGGAGSLKKKKDIFVRSVDLGYRPNRKKKESRAYV